MNRLLITLFLCLSTYTSTSLGQETSVAPDINRGYKSSDLDVDRWAKMFTGESREVFTSRFDILDVLNLQEGDRVADIGAGTGLYTQLFANKVGPTGKVYANDIAQKFLDFIDQNAKDDGLNNVTTVLGADKTSNIASASVDIVFLSDVYHHFEYPQTMVEDLANILVDGGEMFLIDFKRIPGVTSESRMEHVRAGKETFIEEIEASGFSLVKEVEMPSLVENYMLHFRKD